MQTKHSLWYLPVSRPSAEETDLPVMGSLHPLQLPLFVVRRRTGFSPGLDGVWDRVGLRRGGGTRPSGIVGFGGGPIESGEGSRFPPCARALFRGGEDEGPSLTRRSVIDDWISTMGLSVFSEDALLHGARSGAAERGGLERELARLTWLEPEASEDCDSDGVWYGLLIPNSAARFKSDGTGGILSDRPVPGLEKLGCLGGGVLDRSGPTRDGFRGISRGVGIVLSNKLGLLVVGSFEGLRNIESRSRGCLCIGSAPLGRGNVCDLDSSRTGSGPTPPADNGGPKPP